MTNEKTTLERKLEDVQGVHITPYGSVIQSYALANLSDGTDEKRVLAIGGHQNSGLPALDFLPTGITATILDSGVIVHGRFRAVLYAGKLEYQQEIKSMLEKCYGNIAVEFDEHHPSYYDDGKKC